MSDQGEFSYKQTGLSSLVSRALYTSPIPPAPMAETISYGPSCRPASRGIVYSEVSAVRSMRVSAGFVHLLNWALGSLRPQPSSLLPTSLE